MQIPVWWEPLVPGSAMERESSVCIRFEQLWAPQRDAEAMATRQQIRSRLVEIINKIQQVSGVDNALLWPRMSATSHTSIKRAS